MSAPNGATITNAHPLPPPLLEAGLPLPTTAELPTGLAVRLPCGATAGELALLLVAGTGLGDVVTADAGGWYVAGAALVGTGAGTDETCETWETWETCPPEPDT
jgi:hypothetical protein